ncbi:MAG: CARDB domain-containing protein [Eubacteriales bacterium]|nr:CARDB domain-containing protein [Eubacteriales bacterium]
MKTRKLKFLVSAIIVFTLIAATMTSTFAATIYTQNESGNRYTRKATYNTFTMASGAPSGGGGSLADRGTWGMFHSDGISGYNNAEVPVRTDVHYYNQNGSPTLDWNNSNFVYCIHNRKRSPSGTYYPEISFGSVPSYVNSSVWRNDSAMKDAVTRNGVLIILQNGFPVTDFGFANKSDAYSATAMAIRFWMAERERDLNVAGSWTYLWNYNVYDTSRSGTYGTVEAISGFATLARNQAALSRARQLLTLARQAKSGGGLRGASTLTANGGTASISGNNFVFTTSVNHSNLDDYSWTHNLPSGSAISKSSDGRTLSISIPKSTANANKSFSVTLNCFDKAHVNNFVFAPITTDNTYQALVGISSHLGRNPVISRALTITTPSIPPDLSISALSTTKTTYNPGETVTVTTNVSNIGHSTSAGTTLTVKLAGTTVGTRSVPTIAAGASWGTQTFTFAAPTTTSTTTYAVNVSIPSSQSPTGTTSRSVTITVRGRPDLDITSLSANKSTYNAGEAIVISTNVRNKGFSTSAQSAMTFKIDGAVRETRTIPALAASGSWGAQTFSFSAPETYTINVSIPSGQSPTGTTSRTISVTVLGLPDLAVVESTAQNYFTDKDVVISALVRNYNPIAVPEAEVRLTFAGKNLIEKIPIPAGGRNRAVFRIRTPVNPGQYAITIAADPDNRINETNNNNNVLTQTVTIANENRVPMPDPDKSSLEQYYLTHGKTLPALSLPTSQRRHSWQEIRLENGSYVTRTYWMQLDTVFGINPDPRVAIPGKPDLIESGFGIENEAKMVITTNYDRPDKLVGPQMVYLFYPETAYGKSPFTNYADSLEILNGTKGAHNSLWHYPISPFSLTGSRLHYTPLWTPDGSYDVMAKSFYAWSPVGQMYDFKSDSVTIEGDMYDRVTVVRR